MNIIYTTDYQSNKYAPGTLHETNENGLFEILGKVGGEAGNITYAIRFINTGTVRSVLVSNISKGAVKDPNARTVFGQGYIGFGPHQTKKGSKMTKEHTAWFCMLRRCYSGYDSNRVGEVEVCERWKSFQHFCDDIQSLGGYEEWKADKGYVLDKDKIGNSKLYSKETCVFIPRSENSSIGSSKTAARHCISPSGEIYPVRNTTAFSLEHNLNQQCISRVLAGTREHHKGWRLYKGPLAD